MFKSFNWNRLLSILGFLVMIISIIVISGTYDKKKINEGQIQVKARVIEAPEDCSVITTRGGYCKLEYNGKIHVKRAGNKFCHLVSGKKEVVVLANESGSKILFIGEYDSSQFIYGILLMILSVVVIIKGFKQSNN